MIEVNGKSVLETMETSIQLNIKNGDLVEVKSSISCEGKWSQQIDFLKEILVFPNPATDYINLYIPDYLHQNTHRIQLYNYTGKMMIDQEYPIINQYLKIPLVDLASGLYILKLQLDSSLTFKVIKK